MRNHYLELAEKELRSTLVKWAVKKDMQWQIEALIESGILNNINFNKGD